MREKHSGSVNQTAFTGMIALAGIAVIWIVGFILYSAYHRTGINYWLGFGFGLGGFVAAAFFGAVRAKEGTPETAAVPAYYTGIYLVVVIALNIVFALMPSFMNPTAFIIGNMAVFVVYSLLIYNAGKYVKSVEERTRYAAAKTEAKESVSREMAALIGISTDEGVRRELLKLKEKIDYGNSISQETADIFLEKLYDIRTAMSEGVGADIVAAGIKEADKVWNSRNSGAGTR